MKTLLKFFSVAFTMLFVFVLSAKAQVFSDVTNFDSYFENFGMFVLALPFVVEFVKRQMLPTLTGLGLQILSWSAGIFLSFIGWALKLGMFENLVWWQALSIGAFATLAANGVFDSGVITWFLKKIKFIK